MKLVICEKNIAAKRIASILSSGKVQSKRIGKIPIYEFSKDKELWDVIGLKGHIINLDYPAGYNQWMQVSPHNLINVDPCKKISEKDIATALKSLVKNNPFLIVATDYDREGELIGVEAIDLIKTFNKDLNQIHRARFSAITKYEISQAFDKLRNVDYNLSSAGEARQIVDLVWGAVLTRFISITSNQMGKNYLSIGRVQSPTLALLVEREKEIQHFIPEPFWQIIARLKKDKLFKAVHREGKFWEEQKAKDVYNKVKDCSEATVDEVKKVTEHELPPSPFNTTMFLQAASSLGFTAAKAMSIAEELYMSGLISYPRTDNTVYPSSLNLRSIVEKLLKSPFDKEAQEVLSNGRQQPTWGKKKATDHPPIHPVGVLQGTKLHSDHGKIYELVCRRFLATLAKDAVSETSDVLLDIAGEQFTAKGYKVLEPHWKSIYPYFKAKGKPIPDLEKGKKIKITSITLKEEQTKPPQRYSQGALIAKMEQLSLGTKSTRHDIIQKLYGRNYITGSPPVPTSTAIAVVDSLTGCQVIEPKMTAQLEEDMNAIAEGKKTLDEIVKESRQMLTKVMKSLEQDKDEIKTSIKQALKEQNTMGKCPACGKDLIIRKSKKGKRFVGCTGYPNCSNTYSLPQMGSITRTSETCSACSTPVVQVKMRGKRAWQLCLNSECPKKKKNNNQQVVTSSSS